MWLIIYFSVSLSLQRSTQLKQVNEGKQENEFKGDKSGNFSNIVRQLAAEDTPAYHKMMRNKFDHFSVILPETVDITTRQVPKGGHKVIRATEQLTLGFLASKQTVSMVTTECAIIMRVTDQRKNVMQCLLLQKPHVTSKTKEHVACLERRMILWTEGDIERLISDGRSIQKHLFSCVRRSRAGKDCKGI